MDCILASMSLSIYLSESVFLAFSLFFYKFLGFLSQDNAGKNIDQVFSEYQERQKMQAVENWLKYCKRPLPKCFKEFIEKQLGFKTIPFLESYSSLYG
jgi:hypothetical protein